VKPLGVFTLSFSQPLDCSMLFFFCICAAEVVCFQGGCEMWEVCSDRFAVNRRGPHSRAAGTR
jgi:hypothetical protein